MVGPALSETLNVVEEVRRGERTRVDGRHLVTLHDWAARLEQEVHMMLPYLDRLDREAIRKGMEEKRAEG